jgi:hypothetical protein
MPIRFLNIRTNEELVAETEPQISALWFSSDKGPNVNQGQDFGWRLAPAVVVEMEQIMRDPMQMQVVASRRGTMIEDLRETDVLDYIAAKTLASDAPIADTNDYTDAYNEKIKRLRVRAVTEAERNAEAAKANTVTTQTTESIADMRERVELAERLAAAEAKSAANKPPKK